MDIKWASRPWEDTVERTFLNLFTQQEIRCLSPSRRTKQSKELALDCTIPLKVSLKLLTSLDHG